MTRDHFLNNAAWRVYERTAVARRARLSRIGGHALRAIACFGYLIGAVLLWHWWTVR